ncbi:MAG: Qat anti-phage system QueC-like protein QatC, partial [Candidatus Cryosericum sp.]
MRRHVLIGRFGPLDNAQVAIAADEVPTQIDLVASQKRFKYGIGDALDNLKALGVFPSEMGLDVLVVAALVHAADTRLSRFTESQDKWTREIRLSLPVSNQERWTMTAPLLRRLLNFLTGDRWEFTFRIRPSTFIEIVPARPGLLIGAPFDSLSLFSGGLDSLIGAIDTLERGDTPLLVSHAGEGAVSDAQNTCFNALKTHYSSRPFNRLRVWMNF